MTHDSTPVSAVSVSARHHFFDEFFRLAREGHVTSWTIINGHLVPLATPAPDKSVHSHPGFYGKYATDGGSDNVHLSDFAIESDVREQIDTDQVNGIGGALGGGSTVERLYIHHTKAGVWLDGPMSGLTLKDNVIADQIADGIKLHQGISNVRATNNFLRNTGDDGMAMWSENVNGPQDADHDNVFDHNTVQTPVLANDIAIYGGHDNTVSDNLVADPIREGSTLHAGAPFNEVPFSGATTFTRNTTVRGGPRDLNWDLGLGSVWFYPARQLNARDDQRHRLLDPGLHVQRVHVRGGLAGEGHVRHHQCPHLQHQGRRDRDQRRQRPGRWLVDI
jgi:hypothetical protein